MNMFQTCAANWIFPHIQTSFRCAIVYWMVSYSTSSRYLNHQLNGISFNQFQIFDTSLLNCITLNKFLAFHNNFMHWVQDIWYQLNGIMFITLWTRMGILAWFLIGEKLERVKKWWKLRMSADIFANTSHDILRCPEV